MLKNLGYDLIVIPTIDVISAINPMTGLASNVAYSLFMGRYGSALYHGREFAGSDAENELPAFDIL